MPTVEPAIDPLRDFVLDTEIADIGSDASAILITAPVNLRIRRLTAILQGTISGTSVLTMFGASGAIAETLSVGPGDAGDQFSVDFSESARADQDGYLKTCLAELANVLISSDAGATGAVRCVLSLLCERLSA